MRVISSAFGIFNHTSSGQEAALIAQIIWYFIEGFIIVPTNILLVVEKIISNI
jgi:hypothetical protein